MPNCFSLTPIGGDKPESLQRVDDLMREHFGAEPDAVHWFRGWYDWLGLGLAMGHSMAKIREIVGDHQLSQDVIDWVEANYTSDAWCERR